MKIKIGLVQNAPGDDFYKNVERVLALSEKLLDEGAEVLVLPELFTCPMRRRFFKEFEEEKEGYTYKKLKDLAKRRGAYIVAGSLPIKDGENRYNRSYVFSDEGRKIFSYDKTYLADILVKEGLYSNESEIFSNGKSLGIFDLKGIKASVLICYDLRFPELFSQLKRRGVQVIFMPVGFADLNGKNHYRQLLKARALDYGIFTVSVNQAKDDGLNKYIYGSSASYGPYGDELISFSQAETCEILELDTDEIAAAEEKLGLDKARDILKKR